MNALSETLARVAVIGIGGSAAIDLWGAFLRRMAGVTTLDYALLGRWIGHMPKGRFLHARIGSAEPIAGERQIGWVAHYAIGIGFALALPMIGGVDWVRDPTLGPAMLVGLASVVAPWVVMQPAMGGGIAGSRTPDPTATRLRNLSTHAAYGLGLYATALLVAAF